MSEQTGPACVHHPDARGVAQCVMCHDVLCGGCSTRIRGRNLCARCLAAQLAPAVSHDQDPPGLLWELVVSLGSVAALGVLVALFFGLFAVAHALG